MFNSLTTFQKAEIHLNWKTKRDRTDKLRAVKLVSEGATVCSAGTERENCESYANEYQFHE